MPGEGAGASAASADTQSGPEQGSNAVSEDTRVRAPLRERTLSLEAAGGEPVELMVVQASGDVPSRPACGLSLPSEEATMEAAAETDPSADPWAAFWAPRGSLDGGGRGYAGGAGVAGGAGSGMGESGPVRENDSVGGNVSDHEQPDGRG